MTNQNTIRQMSKYVVAVLVLMVVPRMLMHYSGWLQKIKGTLTKR